MREVTGSSPVVPTKKVSAMIGALFFVRKGREPTASSSRGKLRLPLLRRGGALMPALPLPKKAFREKSFLGALKGKPVSAAVGSRGRRVQGMPACRSIPMPRHTRAAARSRVKPDIGIRQKRAKPRSCEAEKLRQETSKTRSSDARCLWHRTSEAEVWDPFRGFGGVLLSPPRRRKAHFETA